MATPTEPVEAVTKFAKSTKSGIKQGAAPVTSKLTSTQANRSILLAVGSGAGIILLARVSGAPDVKGLNDPGDLIKIAVGTGATVIILTLVAEVAPQVATMFAWLIFVGALLTYGVAFAKALAKGTLSPGIPKFDQGKMLGKSERLKPA